MARVYSRRKEKFKTAVIAWKHIVKKQNARRDMVEPDHNNSHWRWLER